MSAVILAKYFRNNYILNQESMWKMTLRNFDILIINVAQATHHEGDTGMSRDIQCSCMSIMSVCWTLFKSKSIWDSFDLSCILQKGDLLFKSLNNCRYLGMEGLPQVFFIESSSTGAEERERLVLWHILCRLLKLKATVNR